MDIALVLDKLVPGGDWQGSVTDNTKESFYNIRWNDKRPKPTWEEMELNWVEIEPVLNEAKLSEEKIHKRMRELAIESLKANGELNGLHS